jgi:hypothetical protein
LKAGYRVTGTARNQAKAEKMQKAFEKYDNDRLDFTTTGDLKGDGAFEDAVKGRHKDSMHLKVKY